ncbi:hypothetical protein C8R47DRAFT_1134254 [Mycena vitilis]|nr:hypothetical protein C8R47DRAFT_1134254 [Mycena vitilis]
MAFNMAMNSAQKSKKLERNLKSVSHQEAAVHSLPHSQTQNGMDCGQNTLESGQVVAVKMSWPVGAREDVGRAIYGGPVDRAAFADRAIRYSSKAAVIRSHNIPDVEPHIMRFTASRTGRSLIHAESSAELCMALIHALLGYLSLCHSGFMHGDINAGNVLLAEDLTENKSSPSARSTTARAVDISNGPIIDTQCSQLEESPTDVVSEMKELVAKFSTGAKCNAFIAGDDAGVKWSEHAASNRDRDTQSATQQFMALRLQHAMMRRRPHLHSPVHDIESFFSTVTVSSIPKMILLGNKGLLKGITTPRMSSCPSWDGTVNGITAALLLGFFSEASPSEKMGGDAANTVDRMEHSDAEP